MKAKRIPGEICLRIVKGKSVIDIYPDTDRVPKLPVRIKYENKFYSLPHSTSLTEVLESFENCYSEEQVFETLLNYTTK